MLLIKACRVPAADPAALEADEAARKRGMARLQQLLDTGGGVADPDKAGGQLQEAMPHQDCCCRGWMDCSVWIVVHRMHVWLVSHLTSHP